MGEHWKDEGIRQLKQNLLTLSRSLDIQAGTAKTMSGIIKGFKEENLMLKAKIQELEQEIMLKKSVRNLAIPDYLKIVPGGKESAPQDAATS